MSKFVAFSADSTKWLYGCFVSLTRIQLLFPFFPLFCFPFSWFSLVHRQLGFHGFTFAHVLRWFSSLPTRVPECFENFVFAPILDIFQTGIESFQGLNCVARASQHCYRTITIFLSALAYLVYLILVFYNAFVIVNLFDSETTIFDISFFCCCFFLEV